VSDLIGQLDTYKRYFEQEKNKEWALKKYGVKIKNPRLIGIVGNYDNFLQDEVDLVLRQYKDDIVIISYSDLINLLRKVDQ